MSFFQAHDPSSRSSAARWFFYFFYFRFLQKYIFDLQIYKNIPRPPRAARQRGGRGISEKNFVEKIARRSLGAAARQRGGRPPKPPGSRATGPGRPAAGRPAVIFAI